MISKLSASHRRVIAAYFLLFFSLSYYPLYAGNGNSHKALPSQTTKQSIPAKKLSKTYDSKKERAISNALQAAKRSIGGPTQPEMTSFKSVSTDNLVNLFTGDFSYNIPLMDVGGYPINIFYNGGVGMEQEASWVGLGWNINPGSITRSIRGVPDDFDGTEKLLQIQNVKPNITWGVNLTGNAEATGIELSLGSSLGMSFNNYLGPAMEVSRSANFTLFSIGDKTSPEKNPSPTADTLGNKIKVGVSATLSSRDGMTLSAGVSLASKSFLQNNNLSNSFGLSTSYNSRVGIKSLQISEQMDYYKKREEQHNWLQSSTYLPANLGTTISFSRPSYIPAIRLPITNRSISGRVKVGWGVAGGFGAVGAEVYKQESRVDNDDVSQNKPMIGYMHYEAIANDPTAVSDFTRFNDKEVTGHTRIISVPQYTYDVFSIQGEGTGGTFRAYRNDLGYVRDNLTESKDRSFGAGVDIGIPGHFGANVGLVATPTRIGDWRDGNHLRSTPSTNFKPADQLYENVYFRNPGETSILDNGQYDNIGGTNLVRFALGGTKASPTVEPALQPFSKNGSTLSPISNLQGTATRKKRSQVISYLTAEEAAKVGLDRNIKSYHTTNIINDGTLTYDEINRVGGYRKSNHLSEIDILEGNGKRYIYGIPVYNISQSDFTFTVDADKESDNNAGQVHVDGDEASNSSRVVNSNKDGYYQKTVTPAYAHSFLLSGLLSSDYVDVTGNGITEDDLGNAVKFNYTQVANGTNPHKWRTPLTASEANFNDGLLTYKKDNKGMISYGEREAWYMHSIESKSMIAVFTLDDPAGQCPDNCPRLDGKGTMSDANGGTNANDHTTRLLRKIDLYNKADLKKNGVSGAKPIKTVHFDYNYSLCKGTPDNATNGGGKLTLTRIWFTYNGQVKTNRSQYLFAYENGQGGNPNYSTISSDRWGTYKPSSDNPEGMSNINYPYSLQGYNPAAKSALQENAGAWMLKSILLPSGSQMDVKYESDDYAFVQNRRATAMMSIAGFGNTPSSMGGNLYENVGSKITENDYVFVNVPSAITATSVNAIQEEIFNKYLSGADQLSFKLAVYMPNNGLEYITSYANFDNYGIYGSAQSKIIWIHLKEISGVSPLSLTVAEFLKERLPGQAFDGYDVSDGTTAEKIAEMGKAMFTNLVHTFNSPMEIIRSSKKAKKTNLSQSFVRLNDPNGYKYGGGYRVKSITLYDNWNKMTGQYLSVYGQQYNYETTELFNGKTRTISSGVASYEPTIGGEENPFQSILQIKEKLPLGPASYGSIEMPVLDAFFPAPLVGYSKVTVRSIKNNQNIAVTSRIRSGIGKQVTQFYTAKDFPSYYNYTTLDPVSDLSYHVGPVNAFFYSFGFDSRAVSQGFLVATNDMHGKMKSQASYAENDETTPINYTEYFYRNTGNNGLNETFDFIDASQGGTIKKGNMGIDIELMTDLREFKIKTNSADLQIQADMFPIFVIPPWIPFIWPTVGNTQNIYRAVTTTKVINYHSIIDHVVVVDKGSSVSTENLAYDSETGDVIVTKTNNEFDKPIYNTNYPAWWAYSGMGPAYKNVGAIYSFSVNNGKITDDNFDNSIFESGDELYLIDPGTLPFAECAKSLGGSSADRIWVYDKNKDLENLHGTPDFVFLDEKGNLYNRDNITFRIVRSGKRNLLGYKISNVISMVNPIGSNLKLVITSASKVINVTATEFKEKWQSEEGVIKKVKTVYNSSSCSMEDVFDCTGALENKINPYCKGLVGNFKEWKNKVFYDRRSESDPSLSTNISQNGFLNAFIMYWSFDQNNLLQPSGSSLPQWVYKDELRRNNSRGSELETVNALGVYSSAQYGYQNNLPTALTNNAKYDESGYESFEDYSYSSTLNSYANYECGFGHFSVQPNIYTPNASIVKISDNSFTAHTGKYALALNPNSSFTKPIPVTSGQGTTFSMSFGNETGKKLSNPGGSIITTQQSPAVCGSANDIFTITPVYRANNRFKMSLTVLYGQPNCFDSSSYGFYTNQYISISAGGKLKFKLKSNQETWAKPQRIFLKVNAYRITESGNLGDKITPAVVTGTEQQFTMSDRVEYSEDREACLPPGRYLIECYCKADHDPDDFVQYSTWKVTDFYSCDIQQFNGSEYVSFTGDSYQDLTTESTNCTYTTPIPATENMLHSDFSMPAGKKMLFSAWVHETCGNISNGTPCKATAFTNNEIIFEDQANNEIKKMTPSGPIIEGWQRYEGDFVLASNVTSTNLKFVNKSSQPVYFDDIRIHPFNAQMKSYVYDDVNQRLLTELDENNYAKFYEYDEEGTLVRTKAETREGVKTLTETRSSLANDLSLTDYTATKYRTVKDGDFSSASTWELFVNNNWIASASEPSGNSDIEIRHSINLDENLTTVGTGKITMTAGQIIISPGITLTVGTGTSADFGNLPVVLRSTEEGTASIGIISGILSNATHVTVEQFISAKRAWRMVSSPITGSSISNAWQEGVVSSGSSNIVNPNPGYGTMITGQGLSPTTANPIGYDYVGGDNSTSIKQYQMNTSSGGWITFENNQNGSSLQGTLQDINTQPAYLLFIRGDRTIGVSGVNTTTLRATGTLKQGSVTVPVHPACSFNVMGNPYPNTIDLNKLYKFGSNKNVIQNKFWVYDPALGSVGGYVLFTDNGTGNGYDVTPYSIYSKPIISTNQGFFAVPTGVAGDLVFDESIKSESAGFQAFRMGVHSSTSHTSKLYIDLLADYVDSIAILSGVLAKFDTGYDLQDINYYSCIKANKNLGDNDSASSSADFAIQDLDTNYTVRAYSGLDTIHADTLHLNLNVANTNQTQFQFLFNTEQFDASRQQIVLVDRYLQSQTLINLDGSESTVSFTISNSITASKSSDRFLIIIRPLPSVTMKKNYGHQSDQTNITAISQRKEANNLIIVKR